MSNPSATALAIVGARNIDILPAEQAAFAGMRVERRDRDLRPRDAEVLERLVGQVDDDGAAARASAASERPPARHGW